MYDADTAPTKTYCTWSIDVAWGWHPSGWMVRGYAPPFCNRSQHRHVIWPTWQGPASHLSETPAG